MISARDGRRYRELIELAGSRGIEESICQGDFSRALDNIGRILRESLDVNCLGEAPQTCDSDMDCDAGATCLAVGETGADQFCSNFEIAVEVQSADGADFDPLTPPGPLGDAPSPDGEFEIDFDAEVCPHGVSFRFAPGSWPSAGSRYRVAYPRSIEIARP